MNTNFYSKVYDILVEYGACAGDKETFINDHVEGKYPCTEWDMFLQGYELGRKESPRE